MNQSDRKFVTARVGRMAQLASIRRMTIDDGSGRGMRVLEVDTGNGLSYSIYPDRGMDIGQARYKGIPLSWLACNEPASPNAYDPQGLSWLRSWGGGLLTGCGLLNVGGPNTCQNEPHGLHGRLSHLPASEVNTFADWTPDSNYTLRASGHLRHARVFGENLLLSRTITSTLSDASITVCDTVENQGFTPSPLMLLYHLNLGWPLIDSDAFLEMPEHTVTPQNDHAAAGLDTWQYLAAPTPDFREQVYYHDLPPEAQGLATVRLVNPLLRLAFSVTYRTAELPHLIQWKMMGQGEYVLGLEPANCYPEGQSAIEKKGLLKTIAPGERIETYLKLAVAPLG